ncbi:hypothetical protein HY469_00140 [Candidatus Roizmanbacteria bacterium]|nr:hypothetical protein [Candidatus Roizmanbacteria bacterium]
MHTVSVVGPTQNRWGQTLIHHSLLAVIEVPHEEQISEIGHEILQKIQDQYDELQPTTLPQFELLVNTLELPPQSSIVIACVVHDTLYVTGRGGGTVYVYRNNQWAPIFVNDQSISGPLVLHDRILLCTPALIRAISEEALAELVQPEELYDIEEDIAALLHQSDYADGAACLIIQHDPLPVVAAQTTAAPQQEQIPVSEVPNRSKEKWQNLSKRNVTVLVGTVLAFLLISSLVFGTRQRARMHREQQLSQVLGAVTGPIDEGSALVDVNPLEARNKLVPVQKQLTETLDTFPEESKEYQEIVLLINKTNELLQKSERKYEINEPSLFLDLSWIKENAQGYRMHRSDDTLVFADREQGALYRTSLENKNNTIDAAHDSFKQAVDIAHTTGKTFTLLSDKTIVDKDRNTVADSFEESSNPVALESFNDNLYLLDTRTGIAKLPKTEAGFGSPRTWFETEVSLDFGDVKDLAIDGSIWVATNDNILKFTQGIPDPYSLQGGVLTTAKALYTDADSNLLYILEQDRVVIFDKKGVYQEQYVWSGMAEATDIVVLDDTHILILRGSSVYQIDRKI